MLLALVKDLYDFDLCAATMSDLYWWVCNGIQVGGDLKSPMPCRPPGRLSVTAMAFYSNAAAVNFRADILRYWEGVTLAIYQF